MNDWSTSKEREVLNSYGGCGYYRTKKVAEQLSPEHEVTVWNREWKDTANKFSKTQMGNELFYENIAKNYDIIWLHFIDNPILFSWLRTACTKHGTKLIMDIDDNFLEVDSGNPALKAQGKGKLDISNKVAMLGTILSFCDAITVSTVPLKKRIEKHIKDVHKLKARVFIVPNANDISEWNYEFINRDEIVIGYCGGLSHQEDLSLILPSIKKVMEKYPKVGFQVMGQMDLNKARQIFSKWEQSIRKRIVLLNATATQPEYPKHLAEQGWSIGIAPLIPSPFNESKSHIKWMEYSMYKIPTIASKVYPYCKDILGIPTIEDKETGLLAEDGEWIEKLSLLIEDEKLRKRLGDNAYEAIRKNWQYKDQKQHILDIVSQF